MSGSSGAAESPSEGIAADGAAGGGFPVWPRPEPPPQTQAQPGVRHRPVPSAADCAAPGRPHWPGHRLPPLSSARRAERGDRRPAPRVGGTGAGCDLRLTHGRGRHGVFPRPARGQAVGGLPPGGLRSHSGIHRRLPPGGSGPQRGQGRREAGHSPVHPPQQQVRHLQENWGKQKWTPRQGSAPPA